MSDLWPNLFIVGVEKGGTTSLWRYLDAHPDVFMSKVKEPNFFTFEGEESAKRQARYLRLFARSRQPWRGEASPRYFYDELVPGRINRVAPESRILIILRNPVQRAFSAYWHFVKFGFERRSFRQAVDEELEAGPAFHAQDELKAYIARSRYLRPIERYAGTFGKEHILVRFLEDLRHDPRDEMEAVYGFLGVDAGVADGIEAEAHNPFAQPRNRLTALAVSSPRSRALARALLPEAARARVERYALVRGQKPELDADLRRMLEALFEAERPALESLLGRRLPW